MKYFVIFLCVMIPSIASTHPGRTDAYGCHICYTNCERWGLSYGEYHCHNSKGLPQPKPSVKSHFNRNEFGYTEIINQMVKK